MGRNKTHSQDKVDQARKLRKEDKLSLRKIAKELEVSHQWVKDVTPDIPPLKEWFRGLPKLDPTEKGRREREQQGRYRKRLRHGAIAILGGKCVRCGYNENINALQIDHINRNPKKETQNATYQKIWGGEIEEYQCLCANCNTIKRIEEKEN